MMPSKSERRVSYENRVEQDGRLTGKHIRTLLHLQDLHSENELLKSRIAELELQQAKAARCDLLEKEIDKLRDDLSMCHELHEIAKNTKEKMQQMQKDCLMKIDENCAALTEKHKDEMMSVVSEKLEAENSWLLKKEQLVQQNEDLAKENKYLKEQLQLQKKGENETEKMSTVLQETNATIESLKASCERLRRERGDLQKSVRDFSMENETLRSEVETFTSRIAVVEMQLKQAQAFKAEEQEKSSEIEKLKELTEELKGKTSALVEENEKLDEENKALEFNLHDSTQTLKHMFKERDLLKNRITGLLNEIAALKSQTPEKQTFADFVHLKRDFNALKEEHEKLLKRRSSKTNMLPTLKAESSTITRVQSGVSVRSGMGGTTVW